MATLLKMKEWRTFRAITQERLAERVEVSVPTIARWESGERQPGVNDIEKLSAALNCEPWQLFMDPSDVALTNDRRAAAELAAKLPAQQRADWFRIGEAFLR